MFSPWPGLAPPVIVPGYVLRIRAWASEHKNAKKNTRTVHSQHVQQQLMTKFLIITIFWSQLPWSDDHWSTFQMREEFGCIATVICCSSGNTWSMVMAERIFKDIHRYKVTGMIYATSPGSKSLAFSSSDAKAKSTWRVKDNEKEEARQGYGKHLDISRVQFFKSGMGVQQGWVLFRQLCKRPLFENLWCQLSMSLVYNL